MIRRTKIWGCHPFSASLPLSRPPLHSQLLDLYLVLLGDYGALGCPAGPEGAAPSMSEPAAVSLLSILQLAQARQSGGGKKGFRVQLLRA